MEEDVAGGSLWQSERSTRPRLFWTVIAVLGIGIYLYFLVFAPRDRRPEYLDSDATAMASRANATKPSPFDVYRPPRPHRTAAEVHNRTGDVSLDPGQPYLQSGTDYGNNKNDSPNSLLATTR